MNVWSTDQKDQNHVASPSTRIVRQGLEGNQEGHHPELHKDTKDEASIDAFREPSKEEQIDDEDDVRGNGEQACLKGVEMEKIPEL